MENLNKLFGHPNSCWRTEKPSGPAPFGDHWFLCPPVPSYACRWAANTWASPSGTGLGGTCNTVVVLQSQRTWMQISASELSLFECPWATDWPSVPAHVNGQGNAISRKLLNLLCFYFLICKMKIIPPLPHTVSEWKEIINVKHL